MLYLTISDGERADRAIPILATSDRRVIRLVAEALTDRLTGEEGDRPKLRELTRQRQLVEMAGSE